MLAGMRVDRSRCRHRSAHVHTYRSVQKSKKGDMDLQDAVACPSPPPPGSRSASFASGALWAAAVSGHHATCHMCTADHAHASHTPRAQTSFFAGLSPYHAFSSSAPVPCIASENGVRVSLSYTLCRAAVARPETHVHASTAKRSDTHLGLRPHRVAAAFHAAPLQPAGHSFVRVAALLAHFRLPRCAGAGDWTHQRCPSPCAFEHDMSTHICNAGEPAS